MRAQAAALHGVLVDWFVASFATAPQELVLDIDASDVPLHGQQQRRDFHAYCDHCYLSRGVLRMPTATRRPTLQREAPNGSTVGVNPTLPIVG
jgi:hypothetical protein